MQSITSLASPRPIATGPVVAAELPDDLDPFQDPAAAEQLSALQVLDVTLRVLGPDRVALASSFGIEDMVILDLLSRVTPVPRVLTLDTGRLPEETYAVMEEARARYGVSIEVFAPEADRVEAMVRDRGPNLFYRSLDDRRECCRVRKVEPLGRALATVDAWVTGLRRDQAWSRADTPKLGRDPERPGIWKVAPLADWTEDQVWAYAQERGVPYNVLHDRGYRSIGCAPCTRAVGPGEDPRAGRWWWEGASARECGLHRDPASGRLVPVRSARAE